MMIGVGRLVAWQICYKALNRCVPLCVAWHEHCMLAIAFWARVLVLAVVSCASIFL